MTSVNFSKTSRIDDLFNAYMDNLGAKQALPDESIRLLKVSFVAGFMNGHGETLQALSKGGTKELEKLVTEIGNEVNGLMLAEKLEFMSKAPSPITWVYGR